MIRDIINIKKTNRKIGAMLKQLDVMRSAEKKLNNLGVFIDNISFSVRPTAFDFDTPS